MRPIRVAPVSRTGWWSHCERGDLQTTWQPMYRLSQLIRNSVRSWKSETAGRTGGIVFVWFASFTIPDHRCERLDPDAVAEFVWFASFASPDHRCKNLDPDAVAEVD